MRSVLCCGVRRKDEEVASAIVGVEAVRYIGHTALVYGGYRKHVVLLDE